MQQQKLERAGLSRLESNLGGVGLKPTGPHFRISVGRVALIKKLLFAAYDGKFACSGCLSSLDIGRR